MSDTLIYFLFMVFVVVTMLITLISIFLVVRLALRTDRRVDDLFQRIEDVEYNKALEEEWADE